MIICKGFLADGTVFDSNEGKDPIRLECTTEAKTNVNKEGRIWRKRRSSNQIDSGKYMIAWSGLCWAKGESLQVGRKDLWAPALAKRYFDHNFLRMLLDLFTNQVVMVIPSSLGYGDRGAGGVIPGGATLYFITTLQVDFKL